MVITDVYAREHGTCFFPSSANGLFNVIEDAELPATNSRLYGIDFREAIKYVASDLNGKRVEMENMCI